MQPRAGFAHRYAGLTGLIFLIVTVFGGALEGNLPSDKSSPARVVSYYVSHHGHVETATVLFGISLVFALFFFAILRSRLSRDPGNEWLATLGLSAGVLLAVAGTAEFSLNYALAHNVKHLSPVAAQALNAAANGGQITAAVAIGTASFAFAIAIVAGRQLPRWLGWSAFPIGVLALAGGAIEPISEPLFFVWLAVTGVSVTLRDRTPRAKSEVPVLAV